MKKEEMISRLNAVMKTLDTGITVRGVENAGNLSGCFMILNELAQALAVCDVIAPEEKEAKAKEGNED